MCFWPTYGIMPPVQSVKRATRTAISLLAAVLLAAGFPFRAEAKSYSSGGGHSYSSHSSSFGGSHSFSSGSSHTFSSGGSHSFSLGSSHSSSGGSTHSSSSGGGSGPHSASAAAHGNASHSTSVSHDSGSGSGGRSRETDLVGPIDTQFSLGLMSTQAQSRLGRRLRRPRTSTLP